MNDCCGKHAGEPDRLAGSGGVLPFKWAADTAQFVKNKEQNVNTYGLVIG